MADNPTDNLPSALQKIELRPLFRMNLKVDKILEIGVTPGPKRRVGPIVGGEFSGERLSGKVLSGGADWQTVRTDGATTLDVRLVLETEDGVLIGMAYQGIRAGSPDVLKKLASGETVDPADYYFRMTATFETADPRYDWINRIIAIGTGHRAPSGPLYNLFEVV